MKPMDNNKLVLENPDQWALDDAYRSLPRFGELRLRIPLPKLGSTLQLLEAIGFCCIRVRTFDEHAQFVKLSAFKGKNGPCYDTGKFARYAGSALAAMDDDNHLFIERRKFPVCEKTANVLSLDPYKPFIEVSDGLDEMKQRMTEKPEPFDCDNFEEIQEGLFELLRSKTPHGDRFPLFYPGPFKILILDDGTMIRRGMASLVPKSMVQTLLQREGFFKSGTDQVTKPTMFQEAFNAKGALALLDEPELGATIEKNADPEDYSKLGNIHPDLKSRLIKTIEDRKRFFILTGSDPSDPLGCCPSEEVQSANALVRAGILTAYAQPAPRDACPITIYAFRGELKLRDGAPEMVMNRDIRERVRKQLGSIKSSRWQVVSRWVLILFVLTTLVLGLFPVLSDRSYNANTTLFEALEPQKSDGLLILLFHNEKRCVQCLNMESYIRSFVGSDFMKGHREDIEFRLINMNNREYYHLIERFRIFTSTPVIIQFKGGKEEKITVLSQAWKLYNDRKAFESLLKKEISPYLMNLDE